MRTLITILVLTLSYIGTGSPENAGLYAPTFDGSVTLTGEPTGTWRWMDVADQMYSPAYQSSYTYTDASVNVTITFYTTGYDLVGHISATGLKPNFAYQLKMVGTSGTSSNELIGYRGRWWQEEWGSAWTNGQNLNALPTSYYPSTNDITYDTNKLISDTSSPTGLKFKHSGYRVFDYFITDSTGSAELDFTVNNSYHVLWRTPTAGITTGIRTPVTEDGPVINHTFSVNTTTDTAYSSNFASKTVGIFGEWERLPKDMVNMIAGDYNCQFLLTEESFHSTATGAGQWALAMKGDVAFTIWSGSAEPEIAVAPASPNFPSTAVNTTSQLTITVTNNGNEDLLLWGATPVTFISGDTGLFSIVAQPPGSVAPGNSVTFEINYTPPSAGTHAVTMRIASNDPGTPNYDVLVRGYGFKDSYESLSDKLKDDVSCGLQAGSNGTLPYYLMLMVMIGVCLYHRRNSIA